MIKKKLILNIFVLFLLIGIVSAGTFKQGDSIDLRISCSELNCSNSQNITIVAPNTSILLENQQMSLTNGYLNISFNQTQSLGEYNYFVYSTAEDYLTDSFIITPSGTQPTTAQGILYAILLFASFLFMGLSFYGSVAIDGNNEFQMGKLIKINYNKYIKQGLFFIGYLFLIFSVFFASEISQNFIDLGFFSTILNWLHIVLWIAFFPIFIIFVLFSIIKWIADLELMDLAKRNLKPYGT